MAGRWREVVAEPRQAALCELAVRLTRAPGSCGAADLAPLRALGLDDRALHDLVAVIAYFNFVNRLASGLEVQLEEPT